MSDLLTRIKKRPIGSFNNYILNIRFPFFKKLKNGASIDLDFPFIALVGPNGSGKSSTLQALYGCPANHNVAHYWFSTAIDPIEESGDEAYRYIYKYQPLNYQSPVEIAQKRVRRKDDPDYWETARPMIKDKMANMPEPFDESLSELRNKTRWKKIQKEVVYIDFRAELSAFDKFFYFGTYNKSESIDSKQDFLRKRSRVLKNHIEQIGTGSSVMSWHSRETTSIDVLNKEEIDWVNNILGKNYISAKIVKHNLFNNSGYSIIFTNSVSSYSEAVAGSGEVSVVNCVVKVLRAAKDSLILLDEPEVSLHPGAQKALRQLLFSVILKNGCQVIVSTHSEHFVNGLPNNAIKLFQFEAANNTYSIINNCSAEQAFLRLGSEFHGTKRKIYVEDELAKEIVSAAAIEIDKEILKNVEVIVYPGGAATIVKNLLVHFAVSETPNRDIVFLDGDMKKTVDIDETEKYKEKLDEGIFSVKRFQKDIPQSELNNIDDILFSQTGTRGDSFILPLNGGNSDNSVQEETFKLKMLDIYHDKFNFMNVDTPEELIWEIASNSDLLNVDSIKKLFSTGPYKDRFRLFSEHDYGSKTNSTQILETQKRFLAKRDTSHYLWLEFKEILRLILKAEEIL